MAERIDNELGDEQFMFIDSCERDIAALPRPDMPLTMGIDGGYVRAIKSQSGQPQRCFEVITGKCIADNGTSKCFGLVNSYDKKPKRRVFEVLKSQGMQMNQQVTFGCDLNMMLYYQEKGETVKPYFIGV